MYQTRLISAGQPIGLERLRTDGGTQLRADGLDQDRVAEYAELYRSGHHLPPVVAYDDGQDIWLADGFHRLAAAGAAGLAEISADIRPGAHRDALLHALSCNASHGLRRTRRDLQHAIDVALRDDELGRLTNQALAGLIVCSPATVARHRAELVEEGAIDDYRVRVNARGEEVTVRGDEPEPMEIPGQTQLDTRPPSFLELLELDDVRVDYEDLALQRGTVRFRGRPLRVLYVQLTGRSALDLAPTWVMDSMDERFMHALSHETSRPYEEAVQVVMVDEPIDDEALAGLVGWIAADAEGRWCVARSDQGGLCDAIHGLPRCWYRRMLDHVDELLDQADAAVGANGPDDRVCRRLYPIWTELEDLRCDLHWAGAAERLPAARIDQLRRRICEDGQVLTIPRGDTAPVQVRLIFIGREVRELAVEVVDYDGPSWKTREELDCDSDNYVDDHTAIHDAIDRFYRSETSPWNGSHPAAGDKGPKPLKQRRKELAGKRTKALIDPFCEALQTHDTPPETVDLWRLALVFGCPRLRSIYGAKDALKELPKIERDALAEQSAWHQLRATIAGEIRAWQQWRLEDVPSHSLLSDLAELIDFDLGKAWDAICAQHPEPASWAKLKADGTPKPTAKKTGKLKPVHPNQVEKQRTPLQLLEAHCIRIAQTTPPGERTYCRQRDLAEHCRDALRGLGVPEQDLPGPRIIARHLSGLGLHTTTISIGGHKAKAWLGVTVPEDVPANAGSRIPTAVEHDQALADRRAASSEDGA